MSSGLGRRADWLERMSGRPQARPRRQASVRRPSQAKAFERWRRRPVTMLPPGLDETDNLKRLACHRFRVRDLSGAQVDGACILMTLRRELELF
jgi:hypothetical protein